MPELLDPVVASTRLAIVSPHDDYAPPANLPSEDGIPLESNWHVLQIQLLIDIIQWSRRDRKDFFAGGNMFLYYNLDQLKSVDYRGPDFFLANNVAFKPDRPYWAIWNEGGKYPDLIVELMSPSTRQNDLTTKFEIYEQTFSTREYVAYDPETHEIFAWRRGEHGFQPIAPDSRGHYWLTSAQLSIGAWVGKRYQFETTWLRFFDAEGGVIPTSIESEAAEVAIERARAEGEKARAEVEKARADAEKARADAMNARADALAEEVSRLRAQLRNSSQG